MTFYPIFFAIQKVSLKNHVMLFLWSLQSEIEPKFLKFRWHGEKLTSWMCSIKPTSCLSITMKFSNNSLWYLWSGRTDHPIPRVSERLKNELRRVGHLFHKSCTYISPILNKITQHFYIADSSNLIGPKKLKWQI